VNVTWNQFWIAGRLACSYCEAMAGSLSVTSTAVSSAKFAVVESGEVGRSAVYSRYNDTMTLLRGTPTLTEDSFVYSVSTYKRKCLLCKVIDLAF
jgi:hypothetical protein